MAKNNISAHKYIVLADNEAPERRLFEIVAGQIIPSVKFESVDSGKKLLDLLEAAESVPDIIFLDMDMPGQNRIETLIEIRKQSNLGFIPIVMYSVNLDERGMDAAYYNGAAYYFIKPTNLKRMQLTIEWLLTNLPGHKQVHRDRFVIEASTIIP